MRMKIGILSDTHDNKDNIRKAVALFNSESVDIVLHAGDIVAPFTIQEFKNLKAEMKIVFGNNDGERLGLSKVFNIQVQPLELTIDNKKIIVMHEPFKVDALQKSGFFDVIIYGHTHKTVIDGRRDSLIINPGEVCGWLTGKGTVVILDTTSMEVNTIEL